MAYIPVLILMGIGSLVAAGALTISALFGPRIDNRKKDMPFECGIPAEGSGRHRFSVRFYLIAILFLLFDVEAIFFFPWSIVFRDYLAINAFILVEMAVFVAILLVGYIYVLRKGALDWE